MCYFISVIATLLSGAQIWRCQLRLHLFSGRLSAGWGVTGCWMSYWGIPARCLPLWDNTALTSTCELRAQGSVQFLQHRSLAGYCPFCICTFCLSYKWITLHCSLLHFILYITNPLPNFHKILKSCFSLLLPLIIVSCIVLAF